MTGKSEMVQITARLPSELLDRVQSLCDRMEKESHFRVTRVDVIRAALHMYLDQYEEGETT